MTEPGADSSPTNTLRRVGIFAQYPPAATMVQVSALIDPQLLVEIELDAVLA